MLLPWSDPVTYCVSAQRLLFVTESKKDTATGLHEHQGWPEVWLSPLQHPSSELLLSKKDQARTLEGDRDGQRDRGTGQDRDERWEGLYQISVSQSLGGSPLHSDHLRNPWERGSCPQSEQGDCTD